jgi:hypothetical protein
MSLVKYLQCGCSKWKGYKSSGIGVSLAYLSSSTKVCMAGQRTRIEKQKGNSQKEMG